MMNQDKITKHVIISGRVQGVFFRACTQEEAQKNQVFGWVRNCANGDVEAIFQGAEQNVLSMLEWCQKGSPSSEVYSLKTEYLTTQEVFSDFSIRH